MPQPQPHHSIGRPGEMDDRYRDPDVYPDTTDDDATDDDTVDDPDDAPRRPRHFATGLPVDDPDEEPTDLDAIAAELDEAGPPTTVLPIPGRTGWQAVYSIDVGGNQLDSWRRRAKTRKGVDIGRFAEIGLATLNRGIIRRGRPIVLEGEEQTFTSRPFLDSLNVRRAGDAVRKVYRLEGHMDAALRAVLREAGWGDELESLDDED